MLDKNQRAIVEAIRNSERIEILVPSQKYGIVPISIKVEGRRVTHDIALAIQNYMNNL